jgi:prolyl oligopeptidase
MHPPHRHWAHLLGTTILALLAGGCQLNSAPKPAASVAAVPTYPPAPRTRHVDVYHGVAVADPYRWLENLDRGRTQRWVEAQNQLSAMPRVDPRAPGSSNASASSGTTNVTGCRWRAAGHWTRNDGRQDQSVLEVADGLCAAAPLLDRTCGPDATIALTDFAESRRTLSRICVVRRWYGLEIVAGA